MDNNNNLPSTISGDGRKFISLLKNYLTDISDVVNDIYTVLGIDESTVLDIDEYIKNVSGKTAELFALSCFLGCFENGGSSRLAGTCREIGKSIGIAFQIVDDILDYTQSETTIGKPVLEDVKQGVYSLPLICAMEENKEFFTPLLSKKDLMTDEDAKKVHEGVVTYNGVKKAYELADHYTETALNLIQSLPSDKKNTKQQIYAITKNILVRTN